jgi:hypothetical protein
MEEFSKLHFVNAGNTVSVFYGKFKLSDTFITVYVKKSVDLLHYLLEKEVSFYVSGSEIEFDVCLSDVSEICF